MKRLILMGLCLSGAAAMASGQAARRANHRSGEVHAQYKIVMRDGRVVVSRDLPRQQGSVVTFHDERSGALTGLPSEQIARVDTGVTPQRFPARSGPASASAAGEAVTRPLQPGEVMVLGPIGDGGTGVSIAGQSGAASGGVAGGGAGYGNGTNGTGVNANTANGNFVNGNGNFSNGTPNGTAGFDTRMLGGGSPTTSTGLLPNGQPSNQPLAGDVLRAQSGNVPTMSIDTQTQTSQTGFAPNAASQATTLNPNGTANTATTGPVAGSTAPIGPNGYPGTPQNVTGPNGFPTTGGATTNPQTGVGPNGFPTSGTAGTTTQQNVTNPNGFPAVGAPGTTGTTGTTNGTNANGNVAPNGAQTNVAPNGAQTNVAPNGAQTVAPNGAQTNVAPNTGTSSGVPQQQQQQPQQGAQPKSGASPNSGAPKGGASAPAPSTGASGAPSGGASGSGPSAR